MADEITEAAAPEGLVAPPDATSPGDARAATFAAITRNGLSNGPIAQSAATWNHLDTRLGEIVAALMKEI